MPISSQMKFLPFHLMQFQSNEVAKRCWSQWGIKKQYIFVLLSTWPYTPRSKRPQTVHMLRLWMTCVCTGLFYILVLKMLYSHNVTFTHSFTWAHTFIKQRHAPGAMWGSVFCSRRIQHVVHALGIKLLTLWFLDNLPYLLSHSLSHCISVQ